MTTRIQGDKTRRKIQELVDLGYNTASGIARELNMNHTTILSHAKKMGIKFTQNGGRPFTKKTLYTRKCKWCWELFRTENHLQKFCSHEHYQRHKNWEVVTVPKRKVEKVKSYRQYLKESRERERKNFQGVWL